MYSNVQSSKMFREGENYIWFIKIWWKLLMPIVINCLDDMTGLQHNLERFGFTAWFGTIWIYRMIWNNIDLQHNLESIYQVFLKLTFSEPVRPYTLIRGLFLVDLFVNCRIEHYYSPSYIYFLFALYDSYYYIKLWPLYIQNC